MLELNNIAEDFYIDAETTEVAKAHTKTQRYPRHIRSASPPEGYVRLTPEQVAYKIGLMNAYIRELGDDFTQAKLEAFEASLAIRTRPDLETRSAIRKTPRETPSGRERDDAYSAVLIVLADRWRVIRCKDGLQYILQYRTSTAQPDRWESRSFPTSRDGLRESICSHVGPEAAERAEPVLASLPIHIRD